MTYRNNIAGIGRDDVSVLNQRQSRSVNVATVATSWPSLSAALRPTTPPIRTASLRSKLLIWGDDGTSAAISTSVSETIPAVRRMARVWRVQESGTVGSVRIGIPATRLLPGERPVLIRSADATFDGSDTFVPLTLNGSDYEATTDFANSEFFTFAAVVGDPGGVSGAALWVKANIGLAVNGSNQVEQWLDQSGSANTVTRAARASHPTHSDAIVPSADILRVPNSINFNPAVDFSGASGKSLKANASTEWDTGPLSIFAVSVAEGASVGNISAVWDSLANWTEPIPTLQARACS